MLQEQPGPNDKEAQSDVDDGDDSPNADELPIAESGALGTLPTGDLSNRVGGPRNIMNCNVEDLQPLGWFDSSKASTIIAIGMASKHVVLLSTR